MGTISTSSGPALIVEYVSPDARHISRKLLIPLDASGKPAAPYAYTGGVHGAAEFWSSVPEAQWLEIERRAQDTRNDAPDAPIVPLAKRQPATTERGYETGDLRGSGTRVAAFAFRRDKDGFAESPLFRTAAGTSPTARGESSTVRVCDDCHIVIVPIDIMSTPRPSVGRQLTAVLLTPFSAAFDIVTLPITFPAFMAVKNEFFPSRAPSTQPD